MFGRNFSEGGISGRERTGECPGGIIIVPGGISRACPNPHAG